MKECNQCGKCCTKYGGGGLTATTAEIEWWATFRPEIFSYVGDDGAIWMSPVTGKQMQRCPWLRKVRNQDKYTCRIYHDRPEDCRHYPVNISEMARDECEMLEVRDLSDPAQAQRTLDRIMSDSRPPSG